MNLNNVVVGKGNAMNKDHANHVAKLIQDGYWKSAVDSLKDYGLTEKEVMEFCDQINFYPDTAFQDYVRWLYGQNNKEALDGFFAKNI